MKEWSDIHIFRYARLVFLIPRLRSEQGLGSGYETSALYFSSMCGYIIMSDNCT